MTCDAWASWQASIVCAASDTAENWMRSISAGNSGLTHTLCVYYNRDLLVLFRSKINLNANLAKQSSEHSLIVDLNITLEVAAERLINMRSSKWEQSERKYRCQVQPIILFYAHQRCCFAQQALLSSQFSNAISTQNDDYDCKGITGNESWFNTKAQQKRVICASCEAINVPTGVRKKKDRHCDIAASSANPSRYATWFDKHWETT